MLQSNYDSESKIWHGMKIPPTYNPNASVGQIVLSVLKKSPNSICQVSADSGIELSCNEIRLRIIRIAMSLQEMGYKKGDLVGVMAVNSENVAPLVFACLTLGLGVNSVPIDSSVDDIVHCWGIVKPKIVFADSNRLEVVQQALKKLKLPSLVVSLISGMNGFIFLEDLLQPKKDEENFIAPILENLDETISIILCTSGSTGLPKAVCVSQKQMIMLMVPFWNMHSSDDEVIFNFSPLNWATGNIFLIVGTLYCSKRIITRQPASVDVLIDIIEKYQPTTVLTVPLMVTELLKSDKLKSFPSIKTYIATGAAISKTLTEKLLQFIPNGKIVNAYGSSENGAVVTVGERKFESIGKLLPNYELRIEGANGENLGPNEIGEICTKIPVKSLGYLGNAEQTNATFYGGWIHTGDIGYVDNEGFIYYSGRKSEVLKYNDHNVYPVELENIINEVDGVKDSCVVGIQDKSGNDILYAVMRRNSDKLTEATVLEKVNGQVDDFKKIRGRVLFIDEFPLTVTGKILRKNVKKIVEDKLLSE